MLTLVFMAVGSDKPLLQQDDDEEEGDDDDDDDDDNDDDVREVDPEQVEDENVIPGRVTRNSLFDPIVIWSDNSAAFEHDGNQAPTSSRTAKNITSENNTSTDHKSSAGLSEVSQTSNLKPGGKGKLSGEVYM